MTAPPSAPDVIAALAGVLPADTLLTATDQLEPLRRDEGALLEPGAPAVAVFARSTEDVQTVLRIASAAGVPVVPRGAGSGLTGGANAVDGCIILSLERMTRILHVDPANRFIVVQPGVVTEAVARAAAEHGLFYPPDPASWEYSTIGGNLANNAGGLCCVKYGVTADFVLGLQVVLADGAVLRTGRRTRKGVAGYDLTRLFVGSEGTLGVITEATLRLTPRPAPAATLVATFPGVPQAGDAVARIMTYGMVPSAVELLDATTLRAVEEWKGLGMAPDAAALLLVQSDAGGERAAEEIALVEGFCREAGATSIESSSDPQEADRLTTARRVAYTALQQQGEALLDDCAVPPSRVPELVEAIEQVAARRQVVIGTFGHAGDGNMHPTIVFDPGDADVLPRVRGAFDDICQVALDLDGTVTGEHGIGVAKRPHLLDEIGPVALDVHRRIRAALDPGGILNPGKMFAPAGPPT